MSIIKKGNSPEIIAEGIGLRYHTIALGICLGMRLTRPGILVGFRVCLRLPRNAPKRARGRFIKSQRRKSMRMVVNGSAVEEDCDQRRRLMRRRIER